MTDHKPSLFERFVQRLAQVFIRAVDTLEGTPPEPSRKVEDQYLANDQVRDTVAYSKAHPEEAGPRPQRSPSEGE